MDLLNRSRVRPGGVFDGAGAGGHADRESVNVIHRVRLHAMPYRRWICVIFCPLRMTILSIYMDEFVLHACLYLLCHPFPLFHLIPPLFPLLQKLFLPLFTNSITTTISPWEKSTDP